MFVKKDKDIYRIVEAGGWQGLEPVTLTEVTNPTHRWTGGKIKIPQWQTVTAFLEWTKQGHNDEAIVHWLYNETTREWCPIALPQRGAGLSVKLLEDHENWVPSFERGNLGDLMGSVHDHCQGSAFASGTDTADEKTKEGLHLTVGGIGTGKYSLHARSSFRKSILPVVLSDWYEVPEAYRELPEAIQDGILTHLLTQPTPNVEFPEWWKDNVIRWSQTGMTTGGSWYTPQASSHHQRGHAQSLFQDLKEEYVEKRSMTWTQVEDWLTYLDAEEGLTELMDMMVDQHDHFHRVQNIVGWQAEAEERARPKLGDDAFVTDAYGLPRDS